MIDAIRDHLFRRHFQKLNLPQRELSGTPINRLRSVTVLASTPHFTIEAIQKAADYFDRHQIICQAYFIDTSSVPPAATPSVDVISREDVHWVGIPKKELLIQWLSYKTDLLINLNPGHSPLMRYLCAASNCQLKAAIDYGNARERAVDFYLQVDRANTMNAKELCAAVYDALNKIS